jgi:tetratricopeptide (TPR) repeat protein
MNDKPPRLHFNYLHWFVIGLGTVIFISLFFVERTPPLDNKKNTTAEKTASGERNTGNTPNKQSDETDEQPLTKPDLPTLTDQYKELTTIIQSLNGSKSKSDSLAILNRLVSKAFQAGRLDYAAIYKEIAFEIRPSDTALKSTAKYFKLAFDQYRSENKPQLAEKARLKGVQLYEQYLKNQPADTDAKIELALLHVESKQPMTGIQQLVQISQQEPTNYRAQLELGIFSLNTAQLAKAEERLRKVIQLKPDHWEGYYYLGMTLRQAQKNAEARSAFESAKKYAKDRVILDEIDHQLNSLP